jgi:2-hydroxychromene-2-carboxylate isomerase
MISAVIRKAKLPDVALAPSALHPFKALAALRVSRQPLPAGRRGQLIAAFFRACWVQSRDIRKPDLVAAVLDEIDLDGARFVAASGVPQRKSGCASTPITRSGRVVAGCRR